MPVIKRNENLERIRLESVERYKNCTGNDTIQQWSVDNVVTPVPLYGDGELGAPTLIELGTVLRNCSLINPENIEEFIIKNGYRAIPKVINEMGLEVMYNDGGYGGPVADVMLQYQHGEQVQTAVIGRRLDPDKIHQDDLLI